MGVDHNTQPIDDQQAEPNIILQPLDTRDEALQQPSMPHSTPPESDHLLFPMLTDDITSHKYALHWLAGDPRYTMREDRSETVQVPSIRPLSPNSQQSAQRHRCLFSGGTWTSPLPLSPKSIPSQEQSPHASSMRETETGGECGPRPPLPFLLPSMPPQIPDQDMLITEASPLNDATLPGGYPR